MVRRSCHTLYGVGRLKPGVSIQAAQSNLQSIAAQLESQYPDSNRGRTVKIQPLAEEIYGPVRPLILMLLAGAVLLLLIAFLNVVSLLLERAESRRREFAVRGALGASTFRLGSQFLAESLVLVFCAIVAALAASSFAMEPLLGLVPSSLLLFMPYLNSVGMTTNFLIFTAVLSLISLLAFAAAPAAYNSFGNLRGLVEGSRGSCGLAWRRLGSRLVVFELVTAMVLLTSAGLLGKSLYQLLNVDLGFNPAQLTSLDVFTPPSSYGKDSYAIRLADTVVEKVAQLPGVQSVGFTSQLPVSYNCNTAWICVVDRLYNGEHNESNAREVSVDYFSTI